MKHFVVFLLLFLVCNSEKYRKWHCGNDSLYEKAKYAMQTYDDIKDVYSILKVSLPGHTIFVSQYARADVSLTQIYEGGGWKMVMPHTRVQNPNLCMVLRSDKSWLVVMGKVDDREPQFIGLQSSNYTHSHADDI
ncbi:unnamed protein product [Bursaphelenchus okinawaensis]|uniref:Uncharacterized protein n=1 Tax=Bursaphelenchus okinawaensis TaxID=465554 RepID=A0A811KHQ8_9BILA|nr:unnamed protein product [Bursaphelenchus okinawaensis]CAG9103361.1 unnamed protein product [Bursaphelenchus okinawaensis]